MCSSSVKKVRCGLSIDLGGCGALSLKRWAFEPAKGARIPFQWDPKGYFMNPPMGLPLGPVFLPSAHGFSGPFSLFALFWVHQRFHPADSLPPEN
jgi:hypothetical protein